MPSAICYNLDQSKILSSGNGLTPSDGHPFQFNILTVRKQWQQVTNLDMKLPN